MAAENNANVVALQLEKVRDKLPLLYEREDVLLSIIKKRGEVETVSSRNMRIPLQLVPGGKSGGVSMDGGDLGRGSGTQYDVAQVTPIFFRTAIEITKLVEYATNSTEKAIENAAKLEVKNGMAQHLAFLDTLAQTNGNGVVGTVSSVASAVLTMSVPYGAALAIDGNDYNILSSDLSTQRGSGVVTVSSHDAVTAQTITLSANAPAGTTGTDVLVESNVTPSQTVSLFGIKYHQNNATTGTWLNLNRATYPSQLQTARVNANSSSLVPGFVRLAMNKVRMGLGIDALQKNKPMPYMHPRQSHAWENIGTVISQVILNQVQGGQPDALPGTPKNMGGFPIKESIHADQTRIDFLTLSHWGRAVMQDTDFYKVGTQTIFPIYGTSGGLAASYIFYFVTGFQVFVDNPRAGSFIDSLASPAGY